MLRLSMSTQHQGWAYKGWLRFCGRQSPRGHNVVWGLHEALKIHNPKSTLLGFLGGSEGGYDLLGRTKDQIRTTEQVNSAMAACKAPNLDSLVIVGGVTSNTDATQLAKTFAEAKCATKVVGVPVTLNGDLKNQFVEANVGFDTICKYYYYIRIMGRKASHVAVAVECTLQSHPNMVILAEEVASSKL
ncbi:pyrophosphate--fructose 6-phosphate 1-phosphotransferase subunit alpha [Tanacetum coccineum]